MSSSNRLILTLLPLAALVVGFWLLVLGPKREEASALQTQVDGLQGQIAGQEQLVLAAEAAREDFPRAYRRLVVLGKAAPEDDDTATLLLQLERIADDAGVKFASLEASSDGEAAEAAVAPEPQTPAATAEESEQEVASAEAGTEAAPAAAPATEAQASLLPIGATIGPAGLPVMRYELIFDGDFFHLADFIDGIDRMVKSRPNGSVGIDGRLITIDSFELSPADEESSPNPQLSANFSITTFITPADQGITAGASPTGPAPVTATAPVSGAPAPAAATTTAP